MKKLIYSVVLVGAGTGALVLMTSLGCGSPDQLGKAGSSGGGNGGSAGSPTFKLDGSVAGNGGLGGGAGSGSTGPLPTGDANCGSQTANTTKQPVDVLLVLDRSGSMNRSISDSCYCDEASAGSDSGRVCADTTNCTPRWRSVTDGVKTTLASTPDIRWGLKLYSTPSGPSGTEGSCTVSNNPEVPIADGSAASVSDQIAGATPNGYTPTALAITAATNYLKTVDDNSNRVILLATDGEPNCRDGRSSSTDVPGTINAITAAKEAGFQVYVIGIGTEIGNLDEFAQAGGTGAYYPATSDAELAAALASISKAVASCTFALNSVPAGADVNNIGVYLDKNLVPQDDANGWSYGANQQSVVLNGDPCKKVMDGKATTVQVLFGCPGEDIPLFIP